MGSWQERVKLTFNRREAEGRAQAEIERAKSEEERRRVLAAPTREEVKRRDQEEARNIIASLSPEERNVFGLLEQLGVPQILQEIKDEVWKAGEVEQHIERYAYWCNEQFYPYTSKWNEKLWMGCHLIYHFEVPIIDLEHISKEVLGFYTEEYRATYHDHGETSYGPRTEKTVFGRHNAVIEQILSYHTIDVVLASGIFIERHHKQDGGTPPIFTLQFSRGWERLFLYQLNPRDLNETHIRNLIEGKLVDECSRREKDQILPSYIDRKAQARLARVRQAIGKNPYPHSYNQDKLESELNSIFFPFAGVY